MLYTFAVHKEDKDGRLVKELVLGDYSRDIEEIFISVTGVNGDLHSVPVPKAVIRSIIKALKEVSK